MSTKIFKLLSLVMAIAMLAGMAACQSATPTAAPAPATQAPAPATQAPAPTATAASGYGSTRHSRSHTSNRFLICGTTNRPMALWEKPGQPLRHNSRRHTQELRSIMNCIPSSRCNKLPRWC